MKTTKYWEMMNFVTGLYYNRDGIAIIKARVAFGTIKLFTIILKNIMP